MSDTQSDANCFSVKPHKPRMVRVATDRPALAGVALGRTAPPGSNRYRASPARAGVALAKASDAEVATASTTVPKSTSPRQESQEDGEPACPAP